MKTFSAVAAALLLCASAPSFATVWHNIRVCNAKGKPVQGLPIASKALEHGGSRSWLEYRDKIDGGLSMTTGPTDDILRFRAVMDGSGQGGWNMRPPKEKGPAWGKDKRWWQGRTAYLEFGPSTGPAFVSETDTDFDRWYPVLVHSTVPPKAARRSGPVGEAHVLRLTGLDGRPISRATVTTTLCPTDDLEGKKATVVGTYRLRRGKATIRLPRSPKGWTTVIYVHHTPRNRPAILQTDDVLTGYVAISGRQ